MTSSAGSKPHRAAGAEGWSTVTLSSGARLGPYEIVAAIGAGGMGEVYEGEAKK